MIDVKEVEEEIMRAEKNAGEGEHSLSYMLIKDIQANARRWFIIAMAELLVIVAIVVGMIWYNSLPVEETDAITVHNDSGNASYIGNDMNGDMYNGNGEGM